MQIASAADFPKASPLTVTYHHHYHSTAATATSNTTTTTTLVQALRLCMGCMAHRGSRGIALPFIDHRARRG